MNFYVALYQSECVLDPALVWLKKEQKPNAPHSPHLLWLRQELSLNVFLQVVI